jgi:hypothetical protein
MLTTNLVLNIRVYSSSFSNGGRGLIRFLYSPHYDDSRRFMNQCKMIDSLIPYDNVQNKYLIPNEVEPPPPQLQGKITRKNHAITFSIN